MKEKHKGILSLFEPFEYDRYDSIRRLIILTEGIGGTNREGQFSYNKGSLVWAIGASNQPEDSEIHFWVDQDKWDEDPIGLPVYFNQYEQKRSLEYG